jgi:hypothetical protein
MSPVIDLNYMVSIVGAEAFAWIVFIVLALIVLAILAPFIKDSFKEWKIGKRI